MAPNNIIVVATLDELRQMARDWRPGQPLDTRFRLTFIATCRTRELWERELAARYSECGCAAGAVTALAMTTSYLIAAYWLHWIPAYYDFRGILWGMGIFALGSVIGKIAALVKTKMQFNAIVDRIESSMRKV